MPQKIRGSSPGENKTYFHVNQKKRGSGCGSHTGFAKNFGKKGDPPWVMVSKDFYDMPEKERPNLRTGIRGDPPWGPLVDKEQYIKNIALIKNAEIRGDKYFQCNEYHKSIESYLAALSISVETPGLLLKLGKAYLNEGRYLGHALDHINKSIELEPNQPDAHLERAKIYMRVAPVITAGDPADLGNYENAKEDLKKALELDPNCKEAKMLLEEVSKKMDDAKKSQ